MRRDNPVENSDRCDSGRNVSERENSQMLTREERQKLVDHASSLRDELIIRLGIEAGLRGSTIVRLQVDDVSVDNNEIKCAPSKGTEKKIVSISDELSRKIDKYYTNQRPSMVSANEYDYLFLSEASGPLETTAPTRIVRSAANKAGFGELFVRSSPADNDGERKLDLVPSFHLLRRTYMHKQMIENFGVSKFNLLQAFTHSLQSEGFTRSTIQSYRACVRNYISFLGREKATSVEDAELSDVANYFEDASKRLHTVTLRQYQSTISTFHEFLEKNDSLPTPEISSTQVAEITV